MKLGLNDEPFRLCDQVKCSLFDEFDFHHTVVSSKCPRLKKNQIYTLAATNDDIDEYYVITV